MMSERDQQIYEEVKKEIEKRQNKKKKGKLLPATIVLVVFFVIGYFFYANKDIILNDFTASNLDVETTINDNQVVIHKNFEKGLRLASLGRYEEAIPYFEKLKFNRLSEDDQEVILHVYLEAMKMQKVLDLDITKDVEVIKKLLDVNEMEHLKKLNTDSELITFEIAILENDYDKIIELKDAERMEIDERRANAIANAYFELENIQEAVNFTSLVAHDGINIWKENTSVNDEKEISNKVNTRDSKGFNYVAISLGVAIMISLLFMFIFKLRDKFSVLNKSQKEKKYLEVKDKSKKYTYYYED